jgi:hypothetical protein
MAVTDDRQLDHPLGVDLPRQPSGSARDAVNDMLEAGLLDEVMDRVDAGGLTLTGEGGFGRPRVFRIAVMGVDYAAICRLRYSS